MYEPTLSGRWMPYPQVRVTFDYLDPATESVTVWRTCDVVTAVPGTVRAFASGGFTVLDEWVPHSIEVTYHAEMFDGSGSSLGLTGSASITVWGERGVAVFSDPYAPSNAVMVEMDSSFGEGLSLPRQMERHNLGDRVVGLYGPAGLFEGVNLSVKTDSQEQADMLASIVAGGLCLVRLAPNVRPLFPTLFYALVPLQVADAAHLMAYQFGGESAVWPLSGDQVSPITVGSAVSSTPWQSYVDAFATWQDMIDVYPTWLDAMKNPPGV